MRPSEPWPVQDKHDTYRKARILMLKVNNIYKISLDMSQVTGPIWFEENRNWAKTNKKSSEFEAGGYRATIKKLKTSN